MGEITLIRDDNGERVMVDVDPRATPPPAAINDEMGDLSHEERSQGSGNSDEVDLLDGVRPPPSSSGRFF